MLSIHKLKLLPFDFKRLSCHALVLFLCSFVSNTSAQTCDSLVGHWINQDSSILQIVSDDDGMLHGFYQSNASDDAELFPLQGSVNRAKEITSVAFMVSWEDYGSITTWTGYCKAEESTTLKTVWHLVRPYAEYDWERFVTNSSTFRPLSD